MSLYHLFLICFLAISICQSVVIFPTTTITTPPVFNPCPDGNWTLVGSYCYTYLNVTNYDYKASFKACAERNSFAPTFKTSNDWKDFNAYWSSLWSSNPGGDHSFYLYLMAFSNAWWWLNDGSNVTYGGQHNFWNNWAHVYTKKTAIVQWNINLTWVGSEDNVANVVCQTWPKDQPQACILINRFIRSSTHDFNPVACSIVGSCTDESTLAFYAYKFAVDNVTAPVIHYAIPPGAGVLSYGAMKNNFDSNSFYTMYSLMFSLPITSFTGLEMSIQYATKIATPTTDTLFSIQPAELNPNYLSQESVWGYKTSADCTTASNNVCLSQCVWSAWNLWSTCSVTCGNGIQIRTRTYSITNVNCYQKLYCTDSNAESQTCNTVICPTTTTTPPVTCISICVWTDWSSWSACSVTCNTGTQKRIRTDVSTDANCVQSDICVDNKEDFIPCTTNYNCSVVGKLFDDSGINDETRSDPLSLTTTIADSLPYLIADLSIEDKISLGFQLKDTMKTCYFGDRECNLKRDFSTIYNPSLGNCFTFNYPDIPIYTVERAGEIYGLKMLLYNSDAVCTSSNAGFKIYVHNVTEFPFVDNLGYNVPAGFTSSFAISKVNYNYLAHPYGSCIPLTTNTYYYSGNYTTEGCYRSCFSDQISKACGCTDPKYPLPSGYNYCTISEKKCIDYYTNCALDELLQNCHCNLPCRETSFKSTVIKSAMFNPSFLHEFCSTQNQTLEDCLIYGKKNFAILQLSIKSLQMYSYDEAASYQIINLVNEFSNIVGLLLGASVITIPEIFIFCLNITCCRFWK